MYKLAVATILLTSAFANALQCPVIFQKLIGIKYEAKESDYIYSPNAGQYLKINLGSDQFGRQHIEINSKKRLSDDNEQSQTIAVNHDPREQSLVYSLLAKAREIIPVQIGKTKFAVVTEPTILDEQGILKTNMRLIELSNNPRVTPFIRSADKSDKVTIRGLWVTPLDSKSHFNLLYSIIDKQGFSRIYRKLGTVPNRDGTSGMVSIPEGEREILAVRDNITPLLMTDINTRWSSGRVVYISNGGQAVIHDISKKLIDPNDPSDTLVNSVKLDLDGKKLLSLRLLRDPLSYASYIYRGLVTAENLQTHEIEYSIFDITKAPQLAKPSIPNADVRKYLEANGITSQSGVVLIQENGVNKKVSAFDLSKPQPTMVAQKLDEKLAKVLLETQDIVDETTPTENL